jgi:hypothetical protein
MLMKKILSKIQFLWALLFSERPIDTIDVGAIGGERVTFSAPQLPQNISVMSSPAAAATQNVVVRDCEQDECPPVQAIVSSAFSKMAVDLSPSDNANLSLPIEAFDPTGIPVVLVLGKSPKRSSFNYVAIPSVGIQTMRARYGTVDDPDLIINETANNVVVANSGQTAIPQITLNADFAMSTFPANVAMRQFAVLAEITFPEDIYAVVIGTSGAASPVPETMRLEFTDTECRTIRFLAIQHNRNRVVTSVSFPATADGLAYQLPYNFGDAVLPSGGPITLNISCYDSTGAQVAVTLPVTSWNIPWSGKLLSAIQAHKGVASPGAFAAYFVEQVTFPVPNKQPVY